MAMTAATPANVQVPRLGDRDRPGDSRIAEIQARLTAIALFDQPCDGHFTAAVTTSLRRFQWYLVNRRWRLRVPADSQPAIGLIEPSPVNAAITVSGTCDLATALELKMWAEGAVRPTTSLVRLGLDRFARLERSPTFSRLSYPGAQPGEVLVNDGFVTGMEALDSAADGAGITVRVNQTFRVQGIAPRGAVVPPATRSQHLIGHAVDGNFVAGAQVTTAAMLLAGTEGKTVDDFIARAKAAGLRWGGEFTRRDPIHFDAGPAASSEGYAMHFFFCQRAYADQHPMRTA